MKNIRNFCIIAHIDHGKSTLADRLLELTETVEKRKMKTQILDTMELEQERGITIKLQPATMSYKDYILNLIDTPGHVDFNYEVSRSLAAVEGAILLVDATQGVQAQTIANLYLALEQDLEIIPVLNKIDLPASNVKQVKKEIVSLLGCEEDEILTCSAKTGEGVKEILDEVIKKVPAPKGNTEKTRALIFDSYYDDYRGVIAYIRLVDGEIKKGDKVRMLGTKSQSEVLECGILKPSLESKDTLKTGEIGYLVTGLKNIEDCRVGDTITIQNSKFKIKDSNLDDDDSAVEALPGYQEAKPMVYAGIFCQEGSDYEDLRSAIQKLKLNDAALIYEPENSPVLGFGFRCGFLGLLHLEIFQERLRREYDLDLIITVPSVAYKITLKGENQKLFSGLKKEQILSPTEFILKSPSEFPDPTFIDHLEEPIVKLDVVTPKDYMGNVMQLVQDNRGEYLTTEFLDENRVVLHYNIPLAMVIVDLYDKLKSVSSGYASMNYEFLKYHPADLVKMDILVAEDAVDALSLIVYKDDAFRQGKKVVKALKEKISKHMFVVKLQAAIGGKIIAAERINAYRKDVTAKLYGGDATRRKKLLEKQKKGKKKMMSMGKGKVNIPPEAFLAVIKR